jgi:CubicO group peptidase (beta-lactamase class C family)
MDRLIKAIQTKAKEHNFSGVVSVFKDNEVICNEAFGYRDVKNKLLNDTRTKFAIASGTKLFTALGIGKLIDKGVLSLNTKVADIDKEFTGFICEEADILDLLTHTSGMYDYLDEETIEDYDYLSYDIPWYKLETPSDYYPLFKNEKMKFKPKERFSYSNGGYVFLGMIIERLSNRLYREFIEENILIPANMQDSGFFAFNDLPENTANGYINDGKTTNIYKVPIRGGGDGGMYTTTYDLNSFWNALVCTKILSKALTEEFLKSRVSFDENYGYGCGVYTSSKKPSYGIVGGDAGVGFDSKYIVEDKMVINILCNKSDGEEEMRNVVYEELGKL